MSDDNEFKADASRWSLSDLSNLDISYNNEETGLSDFMSMLKIGPNQTPLSSIELCKKYKDVAQYTKDIWQIEFDFDISSRDQTAQRKKIKKAQEKTKAILTELQREDTGTKTTEFQRSNTASLDFLTYFGDLLSRWEWPNLREERFTHLFMLFSRTCLLRPEPGHTLHVSLKIKEDEHKVGGFPDARFIASSSQKTIAVTEVKIETKFNMWESGSITTNLQSPVLGQHGIQLLMEKPRSFFHSGVAGFICIGTTVIFTFLNIEDSSLSKIEQDGQAGPQNQPTIFYTKPFDFMQKSDRNEILEPLLKLAYVQTLTQSQIDCLGN